MSGMSPENDAPPPEFHWQFAAAALAVMTFAAAMAYLESAVVVYLQAALGLEPGVIFPLQEPAAVGSFAAIEVGREAATLVMLAAVGWLAGRNAIERLAWTAVAFGAWDILYYAWLWVFVGWPPALDTWDLLFLIPVPWVGPVWAPVVVSAALVGFGLWAALRIRRGERVAVGPWQVLGGIAGGVIVVVSFTLQAGEIVAGGLPHDYAWIVFVAGMAVATAAAVSALLPGRSSP
jgi:hypothetical protein